MQFVHPTTRKRWTEFISWKGVIAEAFERYLQATSDSYKEHFEKMMTKGICSVCQGGRLKSYPAAARLHGHNIQQLSTLPIEELKIFFDTLTLDSEKAFIAEEPLKEIHKRLSYLLDVGLGYLTLERDSPSLSGGEAQRVRLAALIGTGLVGVTYILDEPTIGLHPRDNSRLIDTLHSLKNLGNTVVVVEHDEEMIASADHIVDIGPEAGQKGGHILFEGPPQKLKTAKNSLTADYILGRKKIFKGVEPRRTPKGFLKINGCQEHNLKNLDVTIPLGCFVAVTGVSGSGKSSLISETLFPALSNKLNRSELDVGAHTSIEGIEHLDKVILIDQSPIGRIPRSNPATYIKLFDLIRDLYSELPMSKTKGYLPGRFSFNVKEGCCSLCQGMGMIRVDMDFLEEQWTTCEECMGKRFDEETLAVRYKQKSISDVLEMTIDEAATFFAELPAIAKRLSLLQKVGLGYMRLGQPSTTISGGEAQRVKLARELVRPATGKTLYILDEPTTGLDPVSRSRVWD
ncbi:MAG: ATP-binding cassette domain-containing protein, partial [Chlamydiota bacterium]